MMTLLTAWSWQANAQTAVSDADMSAQNKQPKAFVREVTDTYAFLFQQLGNL